MKKKIITSLLVGLCILGITGCSEPTLEEGLDLLVHSHDEELKYATDCPPSIITNTPDIRDVCGAKYPLYEEGFPSLYKAEVSFMFDGEEMQIPMMPDALTAKGWVPKKDEPIDEEGSRILKNENVGDTSLGLSVSVDSWADEPAEYENCVVCRIDVDATYLGEFMENMPFIEYKGVAYKMSKEEVIDILGEPTNIIETTPMVDADKTGNCSILEYKEVGSGKAIEIWTYEKLGVTKFVFQVMPNQVTNYS